MLPEVERAKVKNAVLGYLVDHGGEIDIAECAKALGLSEFEVKDAIEVLHREGKIEGEGVGPPTKPTPPEPSGGGRGKLIALIVVVVAAVVAIVGILFLMGRGVDLSTPEAAINSFVNAYNAHNADATWDCLSTQFQSQGTKDQWNSAIENAKTDNYHISELQISNVNISGDNATATVSYTLSSSHLLSPYSISTTFYLIKEGGMWKINSVVVGGYPAIAAVAEADNENIRITVVSGEISAGDWAYSVSTTEGSYSWSTGTEKLDAPYVTIASYQSEDNYYVSLRYLPSYHIYFAETRVEIIYS